MGKIKKKLENYWYHYKTHTLLGALALTVCLVAFVQCASAEEYDTYITYAGPCRLYDSDLEEGAMYAASAIGRDLTGDGKVKVTVSLYLEHSTLDIGSRDGCYLTVDGNKHTFSTDAFNVSNPTSQVTLLATHEVLCDYGETISIGAYFPCLCTYGRGENAKKIDALTIDASLTLE